MVLCSLTMNYKTVRQFTCWDVFLIILRPTLDIIKIKAINNFNYFMFKLRFASMFISNKFTIMVWLAFFWRGEGVLRMYHPLRADNFPDGLSV